MKKIIFILLLLNISMLTFGQITESKLYGTWALAALNANDDPTLVVVYHPKFDATLFFKDHAINAIWDIKNPKKIKTKSSYSKQQLKDPTVILFLQSQKNTFIQFEDSNALKINVAKDSLFTSEEPQDPSFFESVLNSKLSTYSLQDNILTVNNSMNPICLSTGNLEASIKNEILILTDSLGTSWYFLKINDKPLFSFQPVFEN
jgi:hypothetical protein